VLQEGPLNWWLIWNTHATPLCLARHATQPWKKYNISKPRGEVEAYEHPQCMKYFADLKGATSAEIYIFASCIP